MDSVNVFDNHFIGGTSSFVLSSERVTHSLGCGLVGQRGGVIYSVICIRIMTDVCEYLGLECDR